MQDGIALPILCGVESCGEVRLLYDRLYSAFGAASTDAWAHFVVSAIGDKIKTNNVRSDWRHNCVPAT